MNLPQRPTALIADDEPTLALHLQSKLAALWPELSILGIHHEGLSALQAIEAQQPEIVFLDICMPGLSGLDLATRIRYPCQIVFVTAHQQHALSAFEHAAVDYLLKPVEERRLLRTIERLRLALPDSASSASETQAHTSSHADTQHQTLPNTPLRWIRAALDNQLVIVPVGDVRYFQALNKVTIVSTARRQLLIRTPIRELVPQLDPEQFWQIHRGTIVNLQYIDTIRHDEGGHLWLTLKDSELRLAVSRSFAARFRQM